MFGAYKKEPLLAMSVKMDHFRKVFDELQPNSWLIRLVVKYFQFYLLIVTNHMP